MPFFTAALVLTIGLAFLLAPALARRLGTARIIAALLVFGFGLVISATLLPDRGAFEGDISAGICDTSRVGFASLAQLTRVSHESLNVLLFVPLGVAIGLLPRTRVALLIALLAASLPVIVEAIQLFATVLGRGCETADIFDNLLGLGVGLGIGLLARPVLAAARL